MGNNIYENNIYENIEWLLTRYKTELELEEKKDIREQNFETIECYKNIIIELECILRLSKK